ncbi:flagellar protein FlbD [Anaerobranca californiensis DSM 14826]|jgi:flagellar protein FlbD|uniref:Flagellar protein FlbD n=1 Tax=Anaerobranca californiensis DSM 14826 TaxID=1120989 RepID=A0A1M6KIM6_9FIRM|nr:flagellar FlbD family protein [Anaerobranca californiensis]SHJ58812.1 flagellar protein FlbD [Anaerobranca californiensis DSM 14826]
MIQVTRLNDKKYYLNCDLIEIIESTPDTVITLTNGKKFVVKESCEEVVNEVIKFKRRIFGPESEV